MFKKILLIILIILVLPLFCFGQQVFKIGAILALSENDAAFANKGFQEGIELGVFAENKKLNAEGINVRVEAFFEDSKLKNLEALTALKRLIFKHQIETVITSSVVEARSCGRLLEQKKIPSITLWDSSKEIDDIGEYTFSTGPWTESSGAVVTEFVYNKLKKRRAVVFGNEDEWSLKLNNYFKENFEKLGGQVVSSNSFLPSEVDFRSTISKIKALNPDVIYSTVFFNTPNLIQQLQEQGVKVPFVTTDVINEDLLNKYEGLFVDVYQSMVKKVEATDEFKKQYSDYFKKECLQTTYVSWGYDAVRLFVQALKDASYDPKKIKDRLYQIKNFKGVSGEIAFNKDGSAPKYPVIYKIVGNGFELVE